MMTRTQRGAPTSDARPVRVAVIGCGKISNQYLDTMRSYEILDVVACADIDIHRAKAQAAKFGVPVACTVDELLDDYTIEICVNLTVPKAHADVSRRVIEAGKSVYSEKPLTTDLADAQALLDAADAAGVLVGCAPDTFLGDAGQTCRRLIDEGAIGEPVAATSFLMNHGNEHSHPDPTHRYQADTGPMYDMGPYYLTALINLVGPIRRVSGSARTTFPTRTITSPANHGKRIVVKTPTHIAGLLDFANGAVGTLVTSFDVWDQLNHSVIYGTDGALLAPDPNMFDGRVMIRRARATSEWEEVAPHRGSMANGRGMGIADLARALRVGRHPRANGAMAQHVVEVMNAFHTSSAEDRAVLIGNTCERPEPLEPSESRECSTQGGN